VAGGHRPNRGRRTFSFTFPVRTSRRARTRVYIDDLVSSKFGPVIEFTITGQSDSGPPVAPSGLAVTPLDSTRIRLTWRDNFNFGNRVRAPQR
jgi:hypothetical protein